MDFGQFGEAFKGVMCLRDAEAAETGFLGVSNHWNRRPRATGAEVNG